VDHGVSKASLADAPRPERVGRALASPTGVLILLPLLVIAAGAARTLVFAGDGTILAYPAAQLPAIATKENRLLRREDFGDPALEALFAAMGKPSTTDSDAARDRGRSRGFRSPPRRASDRAGARAESECCGCPSRRPRAHAG
jgi:hypothetical protein